MPSFSKQAANQATFQAGKISNMTSRLATEAEHKGGDYGKHFKSMQFAINGILAGLVEPFLEMPDSSQVQKSARRGMEALCTTFGAYVYEDTLALISPPERRPHKLQKIIQESQQLALELTNKTTGVVRKK